MVVTRAPGRVVVGMDGSAASLQPLRRAVGCWACAALPLEVVLM